MLLFANSLVINGRAGKNAKLVLPMLLTKVF